MVINTNIVEKIRKLFALAFDNPNENEANNALAKANALMKEHGIKDVDLEAGTVKSFEVETNQTDWLSQVDSYARFLANATGLLFNCHQWMVRSGKENKYRVRVCFTGEQTDVALCVSVWPYLVRTAKKLAALYAGDGWTPKHRSFCEAFAVRVYARVAEMKKQEETARYESRQDIDDSKKYALVVVKKEEKINEWFKNNGIELRVKTRKMTGKHDYGAIDAGSRAGDDVNLNFKGQIEGGSRIQLT